MPEESINSEIVLQGLKIIAKIAVSLLMLQEAHGFLNG